MQNVRPYRIVLLLLYRHHIVYISCINVVGLFEPLSYQDRAVGLAYNNRTSQIHFEPFKSFSTSTSEVWQDGELLAMSKWNYYFVTVHSM